MDWTDAEVDRLKHLYRTKRTAEQIAELMGTTRSAICGKIYRLRRGVGNRSKYKTSGYCLNKRPWEDDEIRRALFLRYEKGKTYKEIGAELGRTENAVESKISTTRIDMLEIRNERAIEIPDEVLADRDRRLQSHYRDLSAAIFGDPVIGQSALDRRATLSQKEAA